MLYYKVLVNCQNLDYIADKLTLKFMGKFFLGVMIERKKNLKTRGA